MRHNTIDMSYPFATLSEKENEALKLAIAKITVLIAGADGKIDIEETSWAAKIAKIRTYNSTEVLLPYYNAVGLTYSDDVNELIRVMPEDTKTRCQQLSDDLEGLNAIFAKLPRKLASLYYRDMVSFAHHVAKASGGFLGFFQIGPNEKRWMDLPMIEPIHYDEEE